MQTKLLLLVKTFYKAKRKGLIPTDGNIVFQVGANANDTLKLSWSRSFTMTGIASQAGVATNAANKAAGLGKRKVDAIAEQYGLGYFYCR